MGVILLCLVILGSAAGIAFLLHHFQPEARKEDRPKVVPVVDVLAVQVVDFPIRLESQGVIEATMVTEASGEVAGRIVRVSPEFEDGGSFREGDVLLEIDDADYRAALASAEADLAEARLALELERARAIQGVRDWEKLGSSDPPPPLVARQPQVESAMARVTASEAAVAQAARNVERTRLEAPYDGRIRRTSTDLGSYVNVGSPLAELFSTEQLEVRLPLGLDQYAQLADARSAGVTLTAEAGNRVETWEGRIVRIEGELDSATRSVYVVASLGESGSLALGSDSLLSPGLFVRASVEGRILRDVVLVPRKALHGADRVLVVRDGRLAFRTIRVAHADRETVIVDQGLDSGELVCLTPLALPTEGSEVKVARTLTLNQDGEFTDGAAPVQSAGLPPS